MTAEATPGWVPLVDAARQTEPVLVGGVDVWTAEWTDTGEQVTVTDPLYGRPHTFRVSRVATPEGPAEFAAGEFANGAWGFYVRADGGSSGGSRRHLS